ncbi:uridine kinase [Marinilactibacillus sp. GCM10026970]|uniref:uridine kinase family protein n=1 Tax=Marinilactibacillus sp. GCM10026970 TaxID=3252642 RepID=UPI00361FD2BB
MYRLKRLLLDKIHQINKPMIIGISGHGAAGKTTFALSLIEELGEQAVNYLNTDPYIVNSSVRKYTTIEYSYMDSLHRYKMTACHPDAHYTLALERDLSMIQRGFSFPTIDVSYLEQKIVSSEKSITIVEGMSVAFVNPELLDVSVYLYTDDNTEWIRRTDRDVSDRGRSLSFLTDSHNERRIQYTEFMHPFSEHFDIIVKHTENEIKIEKGY